MTIQPLRPAGAGTVGGPGGGDHGAGRREQRRPAARRAAGERDTRSLARASEKTPDAGLPVRDPARSHPTRDLTHARAVFPLPPLPAFSIDAVLRRLRRRQPRGRATRRGQRVRAHRAARHEQPAAQALVLLQGDERARRAEGADPHGELLQDEVAVPRRDEPAREVVLERDVGADTPQERLLLQTEGPPDEEEGRRRRRGRRRAGQPRGRRGR